MDTQFLVDFVHFIPRARAKATRNLVSMFYLLFSATKISRSWQLGELKDKNKLIELGHISEGVHFLVCR